MEQSTKEILIYCTSYSSIFDAINYLIESIDGATFSNTDKYFTDYKCSTWHMLDRLDRYILLENYIETL